MKKLLYCLLLLPFFGLGQSMPWIGFPKATSVTTSDSIWVKQGGSNKRAGVNQLPISGGTVTAVSVASANGFTGSSSGGTTPSLTLATSIAGVLKGSGSAITAAVAGIDFEKLSVIAEKTSAYTASAGEFIPCNIVAGGFTITLPTSPVDGTLVGVKIDTTNTGTPNALTVVRGGTNKINLTGTSLTYTLKNQSALYKYRATNSTWYVIATDLPLGQLDLRYASATTGTTIQKANGSGGLTAANGGDITGLLGLTNTQVLFGTSGGGIGGDATMTFDNSGKKLRLGNETLTYGGSRLNITASDASPSNFPISVEQLGSSRNTALFAGRVGSTSNITLNTSFILLQRDNAVNNYNNLAFYNNGGWAGFMGVINRSFQTDSATGDLYFATVKKGTPTIQLYIPNTGGVVVNNLIKPGFKRIVTVDRNGQLGDTTLTGNISGTGVATQIPYFTGTSALASSSQFTYSTAFSSLPTIGIGDGTGSSFLSFNHGLTNGSGLVAKAGSTYTFQLAFNTSGQYGGTANALSGAGGYIFNQQAGSYVLGWNNSNDLIVGASGSSYYARFGPTGNILTGSASKAALNLAPHAAPTTPVNGDIWVDNSANRIYARVNGITKPLDESYTYSTGLTNASNTITNNLSVGIAGGQVLKFGLNPSDNGTITSTADALKGKIIIGTSVYDELNNRLGIGVSTPTGALHIKAGTTTAGTAPIKLTAGTNMTTTEAGSLEVTTDGITYTNSGLIRQDLLQAQQTRVTTNQTATSTTLVAPSGLAVNVIAGKTYKIRITLFVDADVTGGFYVGLTGSASATSYNAQLLFYDNATNSIMLSKRYTSLGTYFGASGSTSGYATIEGLLVVNGGGSLLLQFSQNATSGTTSILAGSNFTLTQMN